ncbi:hypothetical protein HBO12_23845 [Pseudomonas sp. WS 5059]|uniref:HEPN domain-containing protein n=1 Tax=Pseudomonas sp. WS 5059 TaxID=2717491 RepID=UPI0014737DEC|nr:HEPN domain-containing protein [Pseudomonas sp. WS 5059]NMY06003.1 hypothetical protein [Pseudomonas sp. WS 5059]
MKVELLILISGDDTFCNTAKSFSDFLKIDSLISITQKKISYKRTSQSSELVSANLEIQTNKVKSINERFFLIILECENTDHIDEFSELLDRLRDIVQRISPEQCTINTLWDDVGRSYAERSYPVINEIENLMRRLIARFMLITVGMKWSKDAMHPDLFSQIENFEEEAPYTDDLQKLDFIQLSDVLFKKKRDISLDDFDRLLQATKFNQEDKEKILKYIPKSNWEKYFSSIIEEKDIDLEKKWALLYKLRNKVAHNRSIKKTEYEKIKGLTSAIKDIISKATEKLSEININEEDREQIINSYQPDSALARGYISEKAVGEYYIKLGYRLTPDSRDMPFDFIATKGEESIGVEIKTAQTLNLHLIVLNTLVKYSQQWADFKNKNKLTRTRLIFIVTDQVPESALKRLLESIERVSGRLKGRIELHIGKLDEENQYIESPRVS